MSQGGASSKKGKKPPKKEGEQLGLIVYNPQAKQAEQSKRTVDETKVLASKIGLNVDNGVFDKVPTDFLYSTLEDVGKLINEYGVDASVLVNNVVLRNGSSSYGSTSGGLSSNINLYAGWYTNLNAFKKSYEHDIKEKFHPKGDYRDVFVHEMAHRIEGALGNKAGFSGVFPSGKDVGKGWGAIGGAMFGNSATADLIQTAIKNIKKTAYGKGKHNYELREAISGYCVRLTDKRKWSETFAEALTDYNRNGAGANPLSIEIARLAKEYLDGWKIKI